MQTPTKAPKQIIDLCTPEKGQVIDLVSPTVPSAAETDSAGPSVNAKRKVKKATKTNKNARPAFDHSKVHRNEDLAVTAGGAPIICFRSCGKQLVAGKFTDAVRAGREYMRCPRCHRFWPVKEAEQNTSTTSASNATTPEA